MRCASAADDSRWELWCVLLSGIKDSDTNKTKVKDHLQQLLGAAVLMAAVLVACLQRRMVRVAAAAAKVLPSRKLDRIGEQRRSRRDHRRPGKVGPPQARVLSWQQSALEGKQLQESGRFAKRNSADVATAVDRTPDVDVNSMLRLLPADLKDSLL